MSTIIFKMEPTSTVIVELNMWTCTIGLRTVFYGYTCKAILFYMKQMLRRGKATPVIKI